MWLFFLLLLANISFFPGKRPFCVNVCVHDELLCVCVCVFERRERARGRERIGYHLQYKRNEKGVFPWGLIHLPQITLHFLIQPLTFWPS